MKKMVISMIPILGLLTGCANDKAASIGIIGGADGPTAIFVTGQMSWLGMTGVILAIILVVLAVVCFIKRK